MKLDINMVKSVLMIIILLIIVFTVLADTSTDVGHAADNASGTENLTLHEYGSGDVFPLTSFMKKKGIVLLAVMAGIVIIIIGAIIPRGKK